MQISPRLFWILAFAMGAGWLPLARAKTSDSTEPVRRERVMLNSIADIQYERLVKQLGEQAPAYGIDDIFLTKGSSTLLRFDKLGVKSPDELQMLTSRDGIIEQRPPAPGQEAEERRMFEKEMRLRVFATNQLGTTQIFVYQKDTKTGKFKDLLKIFRMTVAEQDLIAVAQELQTLVGDVEGLQIRIVNSQVYLDGQILVPKEMRRVLTIVTKMILDKRPVVNLLEMSPKTMQLLAEKMEKEIAGGRDGQRDVRVRVINGRFFLEGSVDKEVDRQTALKICTAYLPEIYVPSSGDDKIAMGKLAQPNTGLPLCNQFVRIRTAQPEEPDPMISVKVDFVTLSRSYAKNFQFQWAPGIKANAAAGYSSDLGKIVGTFQGTVTSLFPSLDTAASNGYARILKSATVLIRDGVDGSSGGTAPPQASLSETLNKLVPKGGIDGGFQNVAVKTSIKFSAKSVPNSDRILMDVDVQQDEAQQNNSTLSNAINTSIVVTSSESIALGGLISERRNVDIVSDPSKSATAGANGPVDMNLFELGRSHSMTDDKNQFIIFVTPTKLRAPAEGTDALKRKFRLRK